MRLSLFLIAYFALLSTAIAQEDFLAKQYFEDGDFEKAVVFYEKLTENSPRRTDYLQGLIACYQQLERYGDAKRFLTERLKSKSPNPTLLIELGYNFTLQDSTSQATIYFDQVLEVIAENPNYGYALAYQFQKYSLLDRAVSAYQKAMEINPQLDYNFQLARIYGEQGNVDKMYRSYLNLMSNGKTSKSNILRSIDAFVTSDPESYNNAALKAILLENAQKNPDIIWNELLSWLFVQQQQYGSAFRQEKAIYKRMENSNTLRLENLGKLALDAIKTDVARDILEYLIKESNNEITVLDAELSLIDIEPIGNHPEKI
jgi:tetratricopeptide (TPR) repeat protein